ncbi:unnamed protein product [Dibothriocephalus latus]|uniref:BTB domain-containing protein n=1 Tax=Dibothriocephalus latus TaxID=60516 RepID=A0A3P7N3P3_DIBLA|nr:unnamed protein product [Dibothriocephalus latus]
MAEVPQSKVFQDTDLPAQGRRDGPKELVIEVQGGVQLQTNKAVMMERIPLLRNTLNATQRLNWAQVPENAAQAVLDYVNTGKLRITQENEGSIIALARILQLPKLEQWGVDFMSRSITLNRLPPTWQLATSANIPALQEHCLSFKKTHIAAVGAIDFFVGLPPDIVLSILKNDKLAADSENKIVEAITHWLLPCPGYNRPEEYRLKQAKDLFKEVRWDLTTASFRREVFLQCNNLTHDEEATSIKECSEACA